MAMLADGDSVRQSARSGLLVVFIVGLFFIWGLATVLIDTLIPKLKGLFALSYAEVMLTQFCFFLGYLAFSVPAGLILNRIGYIRGIVVGLSVMAAGCAMFVPAARSGVYEGFLAALFVMACGITLLQVAANPLIAHLGAPERAHSRLTLAQAFNSLGTTIGPLIGAALILGHDGISGLDVSHLSPAALRALRAQEAQRVQLPFLGIAVTLAVMAAVFVALRNAAGVPAVAAAAGGGRPFAAVLRQRRLMLGALCIFVYVGAEVSIGSLMVSYLMEPATLAASAARAGGLVSLYWGGAMAGRFIGSMVLRRVPAGVALAACALAAAGLATLSALSGGTVAAVAVIAIGLCNSIMFPTIFSLAIEGLGGDTPRGSGILCMAIVGGAIVPLVSGSVADAAGIAAALLVPAACYLYVALYGALVQRGRLPVPGVG